MRLTAVATSMSVLCLAAPALADTLTVKDITALQGDGFELSVPTVEIEDGNFTDAQVRALFGPGGRDAFTALATLSAKSVSIPDITLSYQIPGPDGPQKSNTTYAGLTLTDVVNGVAASASIDSIKVVAQDGTDVDWGKLSTGRFDMTALLGFYGIGPGAGTDEMRPILDDLNFAGGTMKGSQYQCDIGSASAAEFSARPLKSSLIDISRIVGEVEQATKDGKDPSPEAIKALVNFYVDLLTAMRSSPMTLSSIDCTSEDSTTGQTTVTLGGVRIGGFEPGIYPEVSTGNFKLEMKDGSVKLGNFTLKPIDFSKPLQVVSAAENLNEAWFTTNARKLVPDFEGFSLSGLDVDVPGEGEGDRVKGSLGKFDLTLGNYVNGVPSDVSLTAEGLDIAVPPDQTDGPAPELLKAGIDRLNLDFGTHVHWDSAANTLVVDQLMINAGKLGRVSLSGTLGNATDKLFDEDYQVAMAAAGSMTVKDLTIEVKDSGMGGILITAGAKDAGQSEPLFRTTLAGLTQGMVLAVLGNSDDSMHAVKALGDFIAGTPELKLTITSVDPAGVPFDVFSSAEQDPTVLKGKVTIAAETSGEPPAPQPESPAQPESPQAQPGQPEAPAPEAGPNEFPAPPATEAPASDAGKSDTVQQEKLRLKAPPKSN